VGPTGPVGPLARAHLAQSEPEMARDRFCFLERHGFVGPPFLTEPLLSRLAPLAGLVTLRQTFVREAMGAIVSARAGQR
jgi:hypothetical protein